MRISLITAMMLVSSAAVATAIGWQASANAQQQPTIQVPVPNIPGITTPSQPQQRPYYPPGQEPYPPQGQPYQGQPYRGDQGGYRGDPSYTSQGNCQDLAYREQDIRGRLDNAPPSGQQHDRLVYQLGQVRSQLQRCR
jgi:hypothetical protein